MKKINKRLIFPAIILIISGVYLADFFTTVKKGVEVTKIFGEDAGFGMKRNSLSEDVFAEKVEAQGLEDLKSGLSEFTEREVKVCLSDTCKKFEEMIGHFDYRQNKRLEREVLFSYIRMFGGGPEEVKRFKLYMQDKKGNVFFVPSAKKPLEYGKVKVLEGPQNYYFTYLRSNKHISEYYKAKSVSFDSLMEALEGFYEEDPENLERIKALKKRRGEILDYFKINFLYTLPKSTFQTKEGLMSFYYKFNGYNNSKDLMANKNVDSVEDILLKKKNISGMHTVFSNLLIANFYFQIFEKGGILKKNAKKEEKIKRRDK